MLEDKIIEDILRRQDTPCYIFDTQVLQERIEYLKTHLPKKLKLCYAIKANPFVTRAAAKVAERVELCSPGEINIGLKTGVRPEQMVISGVYKTPEYMEKLAEKYPDIGHYTVESMEQLALLFNIGRALKRRIPVLLRLTSGNQFGLDETELFSIIRDRELYKEIDILGIQYFSGTQKGTARRIGRELLKLEALCTRLQEEENFTVQELEYGGGFFVSYFQEENFDEEGYLAEISALLQPLCEKTQVVLELGRSIAASCGTYLTRIVDMKTNKKQKYLVVDGGIHQLVYYGQTMAMKHPMIRKWKADERMETEDCAICGSLCTVNDILVKQYPLADPRIGDVLLFEKAGAYSMAEGIAMFLSRELPAVYLLDADKKLKQVRAQIPVDSLLGEL